LDDNFHALTSSFSTTPQSMNILTRLFFNTYC
jgi:hypothetical protein